MSILRPHLFRIGCVFCADIVLLRKLYRPYRCHRFIARPPYLTRASLRALFGRFVDGNVARFVRELEARGQNI